MIFLPYENITYYSSENSEQILVELRKRTEPRKLIRFGPNFGETHSFLFEGIVDKNTFDISPILNYRNSFLPQIQGIVENKLTGSIIRVKMKLNILMLQLQTHH